VRLDQYTRRPVQGKARPRQRPDRYVPSPTRGPAQSRVLYRDADGEWVAGHVIRCASSVGDGHLLLAMIPQHGPVRSVVAGPGNNVGCWRPAPPMWADESERQTGYTTPDPIRRPNSSAMRLVSARERESRRRVHEAPRAAGASTMTASAAPSRWCVARDPRTATGG
jgi:hypothetical protein